MMKTLTFLFAVAFAPAIFAQSPGSQRDPELLDCQLSFLQQNIIEIAAEKPGVLRHMAVRTGSLVAENAPIARIDDEEAKMQLHVANQQLRAAFARYEDEIEKQYAEKASEAAGADYEGLLEANSGGVAKVVPATDLRSKKLEWERAKLQIEKAIKDKELAGYEYWVRKAEVDAAKMEINRRVIKAPFAGEVMELFKKQGEWVNPGDPILQYVRYDTLRCDGKVSLKDYDPREIDGCDVTISAVVGRGVAVEAKGRITYVEQQVQYEGEDKYRVQAEFPNQLQGGRWLLLPGLRAKMVIHLGTARANVSYGE